MIYLNTIKNINQKQILIMIKYWESNFFIVKQPSNYNFILSYAKKPWSKFITPENKHLCSEEAIDLLSKMLIYDHAERITPIEAMEHAYFAPIKNTNKK